MQASVDFSCIHAVRATSDRDVYDPRVVSSTLTAVLPNGQQEGATQKRPRQVPPHSGGQLDEKETIMKRTTLALALAALTLTPPASGASASTLQHREHRQLATLHRDRGTLRFFRHHRWLLKARHTRPIALHAIRFARAEIGWTLQLAQTRGSEKTLELSLRPAASASASASWYGPGFYGSRTACGLTLSTSLRGVAHRTLACGTPLLVCYRGRCSHATVVDRGPYIAGRDFDLTGGLAVALGFGGVGVITYSFL
jgi:hypothetical protein